MDAVDAVKKAIEARRSREPAITWDDVEKRFPGCSAQWDAQQPSRGVAPLDMFWNATGTVSLVWRTWRLYIDNGFIEYDNEYHYVYHYASWLPGTGTWLLT